jgi:hypothetical protein
MPTLAKGVNDACAFHDLLERKGYSGTRLGNLRVRDFARRFYQFACSLAPGSTVILYFSGHGCQASGGNRLVFIDQSEADAATGWMAVWSTL